jgi:hypothetical protein
VSVVLWFSGLGAVLLSVVLAGAFGSVVVMLLTVLFQL